MYEESFIRCHKIYFFSWSSVDFVLYLHNGIVINSVKINSFRDILSNKFVRMFNVPFLPRAIRVCKVYVSFQHCADDFVFGEICPIVSSYSPNLLSIKQSFRMLRSNTTSSFEPCAARIENDSERFNNNNNQWPLMTQKKAFSGQLSSQRYAHPSERQKAEGY